MRIRDFLITAAAATTTMALTLTLFGAAPVDAGLPEELQLPPAPPPTMMAGEVELALTGQLAADRPVARLRATNRSALSARVAAQLRLFAQAPRNPTARMISLPTETWSQPCLVELAPGESREIEIRAEALPAGHEGYFMLSVGEEHLASARFAPEGFQRIAFDFEPQLAVEPDVIF